MLVTGFKCAVNWRGSHRTFKQARGEGGRDVIYGSDVEESKRNGVHDFSVLPLKCSALFDAEKFTRSTNKQT